MSTGVGVFRTEGRTEGVDIRECGSEQFSLQLATDGQAGAVAKEILRPVDLTVFEWRILRVEGRHPEHLSCALTIIRRNNRGMNMNKVALLKELMNGKGECTAHPKHSTEAVGTGPQVRNAAQKFKAVAFLL